MKPWNSAPRKPGDALFKSKTEVLVLDSFLIQEVYDADRRAEKGS